VVNACVCVFVCVCVCLCVLSLSLFLSCPSPITPVLSSAAPPTSPPLPSVRLPPFSLSLSQLVEGKERKGKESYLVTGAGEELQIDGFIPPPWREGEIRETEEGNTEIKKWRKM